METIPAKTIITKKKDTSWFGTDYNMNLYKGCSHGCIYCDSRSDCYQISDFNQIRRKENAVSLIEEELRHKTRTGVIATGSMSDPYHPQEETEGLTRQALYLVDTYHFGISIATKGSLITRDIDILQRIKKHSPVICKITITTIEDELSKLIEPGAHVSSRRFEALKALTGEGIFAGILMMPLLPFLTDSTDNVLQIVRRAHESGARFIYPLFGLTLRDGQREYFYQKLSELYPSRNLKEAYTRLFGTSYLCRSPQEKDLHQVFTTECYRLGILYRMEDIIRAYRQEYEYRQLSLF